MKKILFPAIAVALVAGAAAPALAAPGAINRTQANIEQRINVGLQNRSLTYREAASLKLQLRQIAQIEARYRLNGLSNWERADLDRRLDRVSAQVRIDRHDRQDRRYGYGYGQTYGHYNGHR